MKQQIDKYANTNLQFIGKQFSRYLGEMEEEAEGIIFKNPPLPLSKVKIINKKNKFLLGGLYCLQIIGEIEKEGLIEKQTSLEINYEGNFVKGKAFFQETLGKDEATAVYLNDNQELIDILTQLDLEKGEICSEKGKYVVKLSPLSGSFMYVTFPPLKHSGSLPKGEIDLLYSALTKISELLQSRPFFQSSKLIKREMKVDGIEKELPYDFYCYGNSPDCISCKHISERFEQRISSIRRVKQNILCRNRRAARASWNR